MVHITVATSIFYIKNLATANFKTQLFLALFNPSWQTHKQSLFFSQQEDKSSDRDSYPQKVIDTFSWFFFHSKISLCQAMHTKIINVYSLTEAGSGVTVILFGNKCYRKDTGIQNLLLITQLLYPLVAFCGWFANIHKRECLVFVLICTFYCLFSFNVQYKF